MGLDAGALLSFCAVAEELSFARAADRLCISQPPLSRRIRQLEAQVGAALFERTTRSVRLTPAGTLMYEHARRICGDLEYMVASVTELVRGEGGQLAIGITPSAAYSNLVEKLFEFRRDRPNVAFDVRELDSVQIAAELLKGSLDLALMRPVRAHDSIEMTVVQTEPMAFVTRHDQGLAGGRIALHQISRFPLIGYDGLRSPYLRELLEGLIGRMPARPQIVQESRLPSILTLVEAGMGAAIVPWSMIQAKPSALRFHTIEALPAPCADIVVARVAGKASVMTQSFIADFLSAKMSNPHIR
jgi:DNA-binding transcriptional LysR family regulator